MTDTTQAVTDGMKAYADAEAGLRAAHDALLNLPAVYRAVYQAGPTPVPETINPDVPMRTGPFGYLESERRAAAAVINAGEVAKLLQQVLWAHSDDTERAKSLGIDLPMPGGVHPDSGGR